jgi:hypothetical protein
MDGQMRSVLLVDLACSTASPRNSMDMLRTEATYNAYCPATTLAIDAVF